MTVSDDRCFTNVLVKSSKKHLSSLIVALLTFVTSWFVQNWKILARRLRQRVTWTQETGLRILAGEPYFRIVRYILLLHVDLLCSFDITGHYSDPMWKYGWFTYEYSLLSLFHLRQPLAHFTATRNIYSCLTFPYIDNGRTTYAFTNTGNITCFQLSFCQLLSKYFDTMTGAHWAPDNDHARSIFHSLWRCLQEVRQIKQHITCKSTNLTYMIEYVRCKL